MMEFVNGKDDIPYKRWNIPKMFETTNQLNFKFFVELVLFHITVGFVLE